MAVEIETLFTIALGLNAPWRVDSVELNTAQKRIDFHLTCDAKYVPCPLCHQTDQSIHYRLPRQWRHLDFFLYEAWLHADLPRIKCEHSSHPCLPTRASLRSDALRLPNSRFEIEERKSENQVRKPGQRRAVATKTGPA